MAESGIDVALLADTAAAQEERPGVPGHHGPGSDCTVSTDEAEVPDFHRSVADLVDGTTYIDMTPWICTPNVCPPIVDNVIVWRDTHHITATYARALAPILGERLPKVTD